MMPQFNRALVVQFEPDIAIIDIPAHFQRCTFQL
jgi:hypothetical protein